MPRHSHSHAPCLAALTGDFTWEQGIFPDLLHILDLTIFVDIYASAMIWSDSNASAGFHGSARDDRLRLIFEQYAKWCQENRH